MVEPTGRINENAVYGDDGHAAFVSVMEKEREAIAVAGGHGQWSSRSIFILAAMGAAVGFGNVWRFPYMAGEYGGGIFVMAYLLFVVVIGVPVMMAEVMLGRMGRQSPVNSIRKVALANGSSGCWQFIGWMAAAAGLLILSFYSVIAGWSMGYVFRAASGAFDHVSADGVTAIFGSLVSDPEKLLAWHTLFMAGTYYAVSQGVSRGLEVAVKLLMPLLLVLLLALLGYIARSDTFVDGVRFLLIPDLGRIDSMERMGEVILAAMGQAFFTLSLGVGAMMAYGAYLPKDISVAGATVAVVALDALVAIVAGMVIFPLVFASDLYMTDFTNGLSAQYGPGLLFQTLPLAFGQMAGGAILATAFFVLLVAAAWTSAIALLEPSTVYLVERWSLTRQRAAGITASMAWLLGLVTVFSFNEWSDFRLLGNVALFADKTLYHLLDLLASNILLPLGGLATAVFAGWVLGWRATEGELAFEQGHCGYGVWRFCIRYITPVLLVVVFFHGLHRVVDGIAGIS